MKLFDHFNNYHYQNSQKKIEEFNQEYKEFNENVNTSQKNVEVLNKNILEIEAKKNLIQRTKEMFNDARNKEYRLKQNSILY